MQCTTLATVSGDSGTASSDSVTAAEAKQEFIPPSTAPNIERDGGPSDEIIKKFPFFGGGAMDIGEPPFKRGSTLVSTGGQIPAGTLLFPVRHDPDRGLNEHFYFFQNEFGDWKCMWHDSYGYNKILSPLKTRHE